MSRANTIGGYGMTQTDWLAYLTKLFEAKLRKAKNKSDKPEIKKFTKIVVNCRADELRWRDRNQLKLLKTRRSVKHEPAQHQQSDTSNR